MQKYGGLRRENEIGGRVSMLIAWVLHSWRKSSRYPGLVPGHEGEEVKKLGAFTKQ